MHLDAVYEWPEGVEHLGSSPACEVQGMYIKNRIFTLQGHPEFDVQIIREILETRHKQGVFQGEFYSSAMERAGNHHDGIAVSKAFLEFLLE